MVVVVDIYSMGNTVNCISRCFQSSGDSPHSFEQALSGCFILEVG